MSEDHAPTPEPVSSVHEAAPPAAGTEATESAANEDRQAARWQHARQPFDPREKSPRLAALLSLIPGLGQVYIGYYTRGFTFLAAMLLLGLAAGASSDDIGPVFGFSMFFVWLFNIVDAGRMAALYNHAAAGSGPFSMPEDFRLPGMGGSVAGGLVLLVFGVIALSNTLLGISLVWLEYLWPLLPIGLGLYLLVGGIRDRAS